MALAIRTSTADDARAIATIRVETWRAAYDGLLAPEVLARLDVERETVVRAARWNGFHADPRRHELVAEQDGAVVGWAAGGPGREDDLPGAGELYAIYALPRVWSTGVGHALLHESEARLVAAGYADAFLWCLDGNARAAAFYEAHGWREDGRTKREARLAGRGPAPRERRRIRRLSP